MKKPILLLVLLIVSSAVCAQPKTRKGGGKTSSSKRKTTKFKVLEKPSLDSLNVFIANNEFDYSEKADGFYYNGKKNYPEKFSQNQTDVLGYALTSGLAGGGTKSHIRGLESRLKVTKPLFIAKISNKDYMGNDASMLTASQMSVQSPNDFALVKLNQDKSKQTRWIKTGTMSLTEGVSFSVNSKYHIPYEWVVIKDGLFAISAGKLPDGEYAFIFLGTLTSYSQSAVYTFSVSNN